MEDLYKKIQRTIDSMHEPSFLYDTYEVDGKVTIIHLRNGNIILDTEDFKRLGKKFCICNGYAVFYEYKDYKMISSRIHRYLVNCPKGYIVHHINGNTLDDRKENLLVCTPAEHRKIHWREKH